jgi:dTDP-4-amino-4,6-dideoxygalactose transaminase
VTAPAVPFVSLRPGEDAAAIEGAVRRVIASGWFVLGPELAAFEEEFAAASGAAHTVGVGTGTDALALVLRGLGIGPGDEVITTPLSAAYTALAVIMAGARPVFADIDPLRLTIDPAGVEAAVGPRTAAILPVHLYGQAADLPALRRIAERHRLALVEDCCQAHLATCRDDGTASGGPRPVGTVGVAGAFSFYPTKNLGALGDAGAVITDDAALADRIRRLRNGGQRDRYHHVEFGVNSRLDELQAAVLRTRLAWLPEWTSRRRRLAALYRAALGGAPVAVPPEFDPGHVYHLFPVLAPDRQALQRHLAAAGIETLIHYPVPLPEQPALAAAAPAACPVAASVCGRVLSLPLHPALESGTITRVAGRILTYAGDLTDTAELPVTPPLPPGGPRPH